MVIQFQQLRKCWKEHEKYKCKFFHSTLSAEFLQLKNDLERRLDDLLKRDRDLVIEEGYAGTTVISVSLARANDTNLVSGNFSEYLLMVNTGTVR